MELKKFSILYSSRLKIDDVFSLNTSTIEYADRVKQNIGEVSNAILNQLIADNSSMEAQMNKALKNVLTPQLTEMNTDRADRFSEVKRNVTTALKGRDAGKKAAAQALKIFLETYWDINLKAMNTRTGIFRELFGKYNMNVELKAHAATIGISEMMTELESSNNQFNQLYQIRLMQEAATNGPSATVLRVAASKNYEQFCISVEQAVNYISSAVLLELFAQLDELRKTYARMARTEEEEEPETVVANAE